MINQVPLLLHTETNLNKGANILLLSFLTVVLPYFALIFPLVFIFKFNNDLF